MLVALLGLFVLYSAARLYQQAFAWYAGTDTTSPLFAKYWQPGQMRTLKVSATDAAWETERLTSFLNDPDSRFGAMLFFFEPDGTRRIATVGGPIIPTFVRS